MGRSHRGRVVKTRTICLLGLTAAALFVAAMNSTSGSGLEFWCQFGSGLCGIAILIGAARTPRGPEQLERFSRYQGIR